MERLDEELLTGILEKEHEHRYQWVQKLVSGNIVDCSCGMGYGGPILMASPEVTHYRGLDIDSDVVEYAKKRYSSEHIEFGVGNICNLELADASIDSFVSLETLEHLEQPQQALQEIRRVLKHGGVFIGSVPTAQYEKLCTTVYGPNPYHVQSFESPRLIELLEEQFPHVILFTAAVEVGTFFKQLTTDKQIAYYCHPSTAVEKSELGSFMFLATDDNQQLQQLIEKATQNSGFVPALNMVEYDRERVLPLRKTIQDITNLVDAKDEIIRKAEQMIDERDVALKAAERMIDERDVALKATEQMVNERDRILVEQDQYIKKIQQHWLYRIIMKCKSSGK